MAIPKITEQNILDALKYIDENDEPARHQSKEYDFIAPNGKKYSPKYVIAVADHLANKTPIKTENFNAVEAVNYLRKIGFSVKNKQQKTFELTITKDSVESTDEHFTMDNISLGDNYEPIDVYFQNANNTIFKRERSKGEQKISNQTMPRLACQIFEKQLAGLSITDKENFPVCKYSPDGELLQGIYSSKADFKKYRNTIECMTYNCNDGKQFVIYCWNIFTTILFVKECLQRFGAPGDKFILTYKNKKGSINDEIPDQEEDTEKQIRQYSSMLVESKNLIFRGAPGTGKTYLAKQIAANIISNGAHTQYDKLTDEQKKQVEFVQFHPSYDYSDFVEGLRPKLNEDGTMGFELKDGIFKIFVDRARTNHENALKSPADLGKETSAQQAITDFLESIEYGSTKFKTIKGNEFSIKNVDDNHIYLHIPQNSSANTLVLNLNKIKDMLESKQTFQKITDVTEFFKTAYMQQEHSYYFVLYNEIKKKMSSAPHIKEKTEELKYVFIIDEINRGEISKIFGELFFTIDPGYRGKLGEISTQYANMHSDPDKKFYIPDNVYIIGTMNDIDRSVDSFDFAMRRRFRFVEIKADEQTEMLSLLDNKEEAQERMKRLNKEIVDVEDLNENYQIGAAYFLKLKDLKNDYDKLWTDHLQPLLQEYIQGMPDEKALMNKFAKAYGYQKSDESDIDETSQDQG